MSLRRFVAILLFLAAAGVRGDAPGVYAIRGGIVHPVSGPAIPSGIVLVRNGLIEAVGSGLSIPSDATVIDATGAHVYPGLFDAQTSLGFTAAKAGEKNAEPSADSLAARNVRLSEDDIDARRATGVTTILTAPASGIFNGQSAVLNLGSGPVESWVVKSPAALQISFSPRPDWTYPDSLMGVIAYIRQTFLDARQHAAARQTYERAPAGLRRPVDDPVLESLGPVLRRELPVVFVADSEPMMRRAGALARELNLRYVLSGARQGYELAGELKDVPVLVSVRWPVAPADRDDRAEQPLRVIRDRVRAPKTPAELARNRVPFALVSGSGKSGDYLPGIRKAIENGLSADDALMATTLAPARIFGVDRQLGSLERGKIANIVISDRPLFEKDAKVTRLLVDGREIRLPKEEKKTEKSPASPIDGTWSIGIRAPQGTVTITATLRAEDGSLSGSYSGDLGSGSIRGGSFDGSAFQFTISASAQNQAETTDWSFRGTLAEGTMTGTVSTTLGSFEFSGSKSE